MKTITPDDSEQNILKRLRLMVQTIGIDPSHLRIAEVVRENGETEIRMHASPEAAELMVQILSRKSADMPPSEIFVKEKKSPAPLKLWTEEIDEKSEKPDTPNLS